MLLARPPWARGRSYSSFFLLLLHYLSFAFWFEPTIVDYTLLLHPNYHKLNNRKPSLSKRNWKQERYSEFAQETSGIASGQWQKVKDTDNCGLTTYVRPKKMYALANLKCIDSSQFPSVDVLVRIRGCCSDMLKITVLWQSQLSHVTRHIESLIIPRFARQLVCQKNIEAGCKIS